MTDTLKSLGRWAARRPMALLGPAGGAISLVLWIVAEAGRWHIADKILVFALLAIAMAVCEWMPLVSLGVVLLLPVLELMGLLYPPTSLTWPAYLAAGFVALIVGFSAEGWARRLVLPVGAAFSVMVAVLMAVPNDRGEGFWSDWTGLAFLGRTNPIRDDLIGIALVAFGSYVALWAIGLALRIWHRGTVMRILDGTVEPEDPPVVTASTEIALLSPREREILLLLAKGLSNAEIATAVHLSETTVKTHVRAVLHKLDLRSRGQAVVFAYENGLVRGRSRTATQ